MSGHKGDTTPNHEILAEDIRDCLDKMKQMSTSEERDQFLVTYGDLLTDRGINAYRMNFDSKEDVKNLIIKYHVFYSTSSEISQFIDGLNEVGRLWELVKHNRAAFESVFCHCPRELTKSVFDELCSYEYSIEGSNNRAAEKETVYAWKIFLEAIEDGSVPATFNKLMALLTCADNIPPCGFPKGITVYFYTQEVGIRRLPHVS